MLCGTGPYRPPTWVRRIGFVDDHVKRALVAGAVASVSASRLESFSLVLLEAWSERTPTLCDAACGPMAEHTADGGGGLTYRGARSFAAGLEALQQPAARDRFGAAGRAYVEERFSWDAVRGAVPRRGRGAGVRVVIDVTPLAIPPTGIGTYLRETVAAGGRNPRGHEIVALSMGGRTETAGLAEHLGSLPGVTRRHRRVRGAFVLRRVVNALPLPLLEQLAGRADAFVGSEWLHPRQRRGVRGAIVYDLVPLRFPEWSTPETRGAAPPQAGRRAPVRRRRLHQPGHGGRRARAPRDRRRTAAGGAARRRRPLPHRRAGAAGGAGRTAVRRQPLHPRAAQEPRHAGRGATPGSAPGTRSWRWC